MSCYCSEEESDVTETGVEFSKVYGTGFQKQRTLVHYPEDFVVSEEDDDERASQSSIKEANGNENNEQESNIMDILLVNGNEADFKVCKDEDELMERIWWLSKPPIIPRHSPTISARRIQVIRERLSSTVKKLPTLSETLQDQVERNLAQRRRSNAVRYEQIITTDKNEKTRISCQEDAKITIPSCALNLKDLLLNT